MKRAVCLVFGFLLAAPAWGGSPYVNEFLQMGFGVRALSMGRSYVAIADDASALYWNPAGLAQARRYEVQAMERQRYGSLIDDQAFAVAMPFSQVTVGAGYLQSEMNDVSVAPTLTPTQENLFQMGNADLPPVSAARVRDTAILLSASRKVFDNFSLGITGKLIDRNFLGYLDGRGYGIDLGGMYHWGALAFGLSVQDVLQNLTWSGTLPNGGGSVNFSEKASPGVRLGSAYMLPLSDTQQLMMSVGGEGSAAGVSPQLGLELRWFQALQLRAGCAFNPSYEQPSQSSLKSSAQIEPSLGVGLDVRGFQFAYGVSYHPLDWVQEMAVGYRFGNPLPASEPRRMFGSRADDGKDISAYFMPVSAK